MSPAEYSLLVFSAIWERLPSISSAIRGVLGPEEYDFVQGGVDVASVYLDEPSRGGRRQKRAVLFQTATASVGPICVFVPDAQDGWPTLVGRVSAAVSGRVISVILSAAGRKFPLNSFQVFKNGQILRVVRVLKDGDKWSFYEQGVPQDFEEPELYRSRVVKNRLTMDIMMTYMSRLGLEVRDQDFWSSRHPAFYIAQKPFR
jgi:hypothetical protein